MKIIVLDVEATILTYGAHNEFETGKIDPELASVLSFLCENDCKIVLATGAGDEVIELYKERFAEAGIEQYIDQYKSEFDDGYSTKVEKLNMYLAYYGSLGHDLNKNDMYYYDDAEPNIDKAKQAGYDNAYQVTDDNPLIKQLKSLKDEILKDSNRVPRVSNCGWFELPGDVRRKFADITREKRSSGPFGPMIASTYWNNLNKEQRNKVLCKNDAGNTERDVQVWLKSISRQFTPATITSTTTASDLVEFLKEQGHVDQDANVSIMVCGNYLDAKQVIFEHERWDRSLATLHFEVQGPVNDCDDTATTTLGPPGMR